MAEERKVSTGSLPFSDEDLVGPEDRPRPEWELAMHDWRVTVNSTVKAWLDEMAGSICRAVQLAPKVNEGVIYVRACDPSAPKAHGVTLATNHKQASFSLYTALKPFNFPKVSSERAAVTFRCRPETYGQVKLLVVEVTGYRVVKSGGGKEQVKAAQEQAISLMPGDDEVNGLS